MNNILTKHIIVSSNDQYNNLVRDFDLNYKTYTYYCELTLKEIWDNFLVKNHYNNRWSADTLNDYTHNIVEQKILPLFKEKNKVYSDDIGIDQGGIGKLNSIYLMKNDLCNGIDFVYPISISFFDENSSVIHPGGTRMMFGNIYNKPIKTVITDYTNTIFKTHPHLPLKKYETINYNFSTNPLIYVEVPSNHEDCPSAFNKVLNTYSIGKNAKVLYIKELVDYNITLPDHSYHRPASIKPPRKFFLKNNKIYVDKMLLIIKDNGKWKITI